MAIIELSNGILLGLSSDTKPTTYPNGTIFFESNTGNAFMYISAVWTSITSATGEANTASNIGTGTGVFKQKSALDLQFKSLTATSSKIGLTNNTNDVGIDVTEANLTHDNIGGILGIAKGGTGQSTSQLAINVLSQLTTIGDLLYHNGTNTTRLAKGTRGQVLKTAKDASNIEWGASHLPSSGRKWGWWTGLNNGVGLLSGPTSTGTASGLITSLADGRGVRWDTTATINSIGGNRMITTLTMRGWNPRFKARFRLPQAQPDTRAWIGFTQASAAPNGDDYLNASSGFALSLRAADTTWQIIHNDGTGASVFDSTGIATDTNVHEVELIADDANTRYGWSFDGSAFSYISTEIPAQTTAQLVRAEIQNSVASSKLFDCFWAELESDK